MTSLNNHSLRENHGSGLVVTILLVSVMLTAALILLQRIIPYAKNVRGMNDAMQSYYTARGEVEAARLGFVYVGGEGVKIAWHLPTLFGLLSAILSTPTTGRINIDLGLRLENDTVVVGVPKIMKIKLPNLHSLARPNRDRIISAISTDLPLNIKLFAGDALPKKFGTSQLDPGYHMLNPKNLGGLRFDLRGINTSSSNFGLKLQFPKPSLPSYIPTDEAVLTVKVQYTAGSDIKTFTVEYDELSANYSSLSKNNGSFDLSSSSKEGVIQNIDNVGSVTVVPLPTFLPATLSNFLDEYNCNALNITSCSITFNLGNIDDASLEPPAHFQLISYKGTPVAIPDLNAVVVGDGLSDNGLYFQRVVELIPTRQDI